MVGLLFHAVLVITRVRARIVSIVRAHIMDIVTRITDTGDTDITRRIIKTYNILLISGQLHVRVYLFLYEYDICERSGTLFIRNIGRKY